MPVCLTYQNTGRMPPKNYLSRHHTHSLAGMAGQSSCSGRLATPALRYSLMPAWLSQAPSVFLPSWLSFSSPATRPATGQAAHHLALPAQVFCSCLVISQGHGHFLRFSCQQAHIIVTDTCMSRSPFHQLSSCSTNKQYCPNTHSITLWSHTCPTGIAGAGLDA